MFRKKMDLEPSSCYVFASSFSQLDRVVPTSLPLTPLVAQSGFRHPSTCLVTVLTKARGIAATCDGHFPVPFSLEFLAAFDIVHHSLKQGLLLASWLRDSLDSPLLLSLLSSFSLVQLSPTSCPFECWGSSVSCPMLSFFILHTRPREFHPFQGAHD